MVRKSRTPQPDDAPGKARLGAVVRGYRHGLGLSQEELAWRADMHQTYLSEVERGLRNISFTRLLQLVGALRVPLAKFFRSFEDYREPKAGSSRPAANETGERSPEPPHPAGEILLIEDSESDAAITALAFKRGKLANPLKVCADAESALAYLRGEGRYANRPPACPNLILLDLHLPGMSGLEFLRIAKKDERIREIPVVVLTFSRGDKEIIECGRLGAENFIVKPVGMENFIRTTPKLNLRLTLGGPVGARNPPRLP